MNFSIPKYTTQFLLFIIVAKLLYLGVEIYYNVDLINTINNTDVSEELYKDLEDLGHNISSVGFTLLFTPFIYLLYRKIFSEKFQNAVAPLLLTTMVALFFTFHTLLTTMMEKIVEENQGKRYSSYYISGFKFGMLNKLFGYEDFIPKSHLDHLNAKDKVILSNIFLLNHIDTKLIDKMITNGKEQSVDIFIMKNLAYDYKEKQKKFDEKFDKIINGYNSYIDGSKQIQAKFSKIDSQKQLNTEYKNFTNKLIQKYAKYEKSVIKFEKSTMISKSKLNQIEKDLTKYFRYQNYDKAKRKYKENMRREFGHYIEPKRWCSNYCPSRQAIRDVIYEESLAKFKSRSDGLSPDLGQREFFNHPTVKKKVVRELKQKGLIVSKYFNYSKAHFAKAYKRKVHKELKRAKANFLNKIKKETGKRMRFGLNYNQFIYYFKADLNKEYGKKYGAIIYDMLKKRDASDFYTKVYREKVKTNVLKKYMLTKEDFTKEENAKLGDNAIKNLYIPPFAIAMSLIAGILNFVSVVVMILFLVIDISKRSPLQQFAIKMSLKLLLLGFILYYPFIEMKDKDILQDYKALYKITTLPQAKNYITLLKWIMIYEEKILKVNS